MYLLHYFTVSCARDVGRVSVSWQVHQHADDWCRAIWHCRASQLAACIGGVPCCQLCQVMQSSVTVGSGQLQAPYAPFPVGSWMGRMGCGCDSCDRWPSNTSRSRPTFRRCPSFVMCFEAERMQNMSFSES